MQVKSIPRLTGCSSSGSPHSSSASIACPLPTRRETRSEPRRCQKAQPTHERTSTTVPRLSDRKVLIGRCGFSAASVLHFLCVAPLQQVALLLVCWPICERARTVRGEVHGCRLCVRRDSPHSCISTASNVTSPTRQQQPTATGNHHCYFHTNSGSSSSTTTAAPAACSCAQGLAPHLSWRRRRA